MDDAEWKVFFARVKKRSAEIKAELKKRPDVKTCKLCDSPQIEYHKCEKCHGQACYGYGDMCCVCCELEAVEMGRMF